MGKLGRKIRGLKRGTHKLVGGEIKSQAEIDKEAISQANAAIGEPTGGDVGTLGGANPNVQGKSKIVKKSRVGLLSMQSSDILG